MLDRATPMKRIRNERYESAARAVPGVCEWGSGVVGVPGRVVAGLEVGVVMA
jgi:hypothetical protein